MLEIEVVETNIIEGGIEVFARAWQDGIQIGFGLDGSVDVERFRFYNPPVLVKDPNGTIERTRPTYDVDTGEINGSYTEYYKEDAEEAILQQLEHTINVMQNKSDDSNIVPDKRGNTTSTFYPDADTESTTVDGYVENFNVGGQAWATHIAETTGASADDSSASGALRIRATGDGSGGVSTTRDVRRGFFLFDTSVIGTDTITSATQSFYGTGTNQNTLGLTSGSQVMNITTATPASNTALVAGDYDQVDGAGSTAGTRLASDFDLGDDATLSNWDTAGYNDLSYISAGLTAINKTGVTKTAFRFIDDIDTTVPTTTGSADSNCIFSLYFADQTGTANDPKLVVEHSQINDIANSVLATSLVSHWELEESTASSTWVDAHGSNNLSNNSSGSGVTSATGIQNNGADFERTNSESLNITDANQTGLDITGDMTISLWFKFETNNAGQQVFASKWLSSGTSRGFLFYKEGDNFIRFAVSNDGTFNGAVNVAWTPSNGVWYHMAVVYDASAGSADFYIDGSQQGATQTGLDTSIFDVTSSFRLGGSDDGSHVDGVMDEVSIWSRTLANTEIEKIYNSGAGIPYNAAPATRRVFHIS